VVSVTEKAHEMCQVGTEKANVSEPLMKCRKRSDGIETGVQLLPREEPGGYLFTALVVSGIKVARARLRLRCVERGNASPRYGWPGVGPAGERQNLKQRKL